MLKFLTTKRFIATHDPVRTAGNRCGVWPVQVEGIPGPQYFPQDSATVDKRGGAIFPMERRFLSHAVRYISRGHERETLGLSCPGPAAYVGHDPVSPLSPPSSAPARSRHPRYPTREPQPARATSAGPIGAARTQVRPSIRLCHRRR